MEIDYKTEIEKLGIRIKELRKARGYTQDQLAAYTEMNRVNITQIESGAKNIEFMTLVRIAQALEVGLPDLFPAKH